MKSTNSSNSAHDQLSRASKNTIIASLYLSWFSPVLSSTLVGFRLSGIEILPLILFTVRYSFNYLRLSNSRFLLLLFFLFSSLFSTLYSESTLINWFFCISLLLIPLQIIIPLRTLNRTDRQTVLNSIYILLAIEFVWCSVQVFSNDNSLDRVKGSLIETGAGGHIAPFFLIIGSHLVVVSRQIGIRFRALILSTSLLIAIIADAKQVLLFYSLSVSLALILTKSRYIKPNLRMLKFFAPILVLPLILAYLLTGFGGITAYNYIKLTSQTDGGKAAVAKLLVNPYSEFWQTENFLLGAGPAQTVSRSSGMTLPGYEGNAPAKKFGVSTSKYYENLKVTAAGYGYVGESSATSPASSLLGVLGDFGILGLFLYLLYVWVFLKGSEIDGKVKKTWKNVFILGYFFGLGLISEWPEYSVATIAFCIFLELAYEKK